MSELLSDPKRVSIEIGPDQIHLETGRIAKQAQGSVMVVSGDTMVLSAVCVADEPFTRGDFLPLTVDYREKTGAAGRIPGNFFRREGRPTEREILVCRMTDRPIRPLFPKGFSYEVQVCQTVFSADNEHDPGILSMNAAFAALTLSPIPFAGPLGAVRVGLIDGELVVNPSVARMEESDLDITVAGTKGAICMVEGLANEVTEEQMVAALEFAHGFIKTICDGIEELRELAGVPKMPFEPKVTDPEVQSDVDELATDRLLEAIKTERKQERQDAVDAVKADVTDTLAERYGEELFAEREGHVKEAFRAVEKRLMREAVINTHRRLDGRALDEVRPIAVDVGFLPRAHGSCLFTRGETQAIVTATLGTSRDEQKIEELSGEGFKRFMLHYNFPPWSVGETKRITGPGRREIGHGMLAERALMGVVPNEDDEDPFPYTLRIVADITESNGSSSMASVCGGTMSLMDAGVKLRAPVAGVAMGLIREGDEHRILTDILGAEDHFGDMDFKVCGTSEGITAFQMDVKIAGLASDVMRRALDQAREGRLHILGKMLECLPEPREEISPYAPRIHTIKIDVDKIRDVIGPGGKVVREIQANTGADIDVQPDGTINVAAVDAESADAAIEMIKHITADVEVGQTYTGTVVRLESFGTFVNILPNKDGLVRLPELSLERVHEAADVVSIGDELQVKVIEIDRMGRVNLSKLEVDADEGRISHEDLAERRRGAGGPPGGRRNDRGRNDRGRGGPRQGGRDRGRGGGRGGPRR